MHATNFTSRPGQKNRTSIIPHDNPSRPEAIMANKCSGCQAFSSNNCFELFYIQRKERIPSVRTNYLLIYALSATLLLLSGSSGSGNYDKKPTTIINRSDNS